MPKQNKAPKRAAPKRKDAPAKNEKKETKPKAAKPAKAAKPPKAPKPAKATKPPKAPKQPKEAASGGKGKLIGIALAALLLLCGGYAALCQSVDPNLVLPRTRIVYQSPELEGDSSQMPEEQVLDLSGLNREGVLRAAEEDFHSRYDGRSISVKAVDQQYSVPVGNTLGLDTEALADLALAPSQVPFAQRGLSRIRSLLTWRNMTAQPAVENESQLQANLRESGLTELDTTVQTTWEVKKKKLLLHKGKSGVSVDEDALLSQITDAVLAGDYDTPVESAMRENPVEELDWAALEKKVCQKPKNAKLKLSKDRRKYEIVDAVTGVSFDEEKAKQALSAAPEGTDVAVKLKYTAPEITTKRMKNKLFKHKLGSYTTPVSGTWNRISNVRLAAEKCNGIILCKGDKFSYNDTLGERTEANGFKTAGAYLNGTTVQELGGGICQISSTMYAAALDANLKILERHNHTFASSYIGLGMDATVSWGGPDFRWENDKDYPVKIEASYWDGYATVTIWGTRTDKISVEMVSETKETIPFPTVKREDPDLYEGKTRTSQQGSDGYRVQTYRYVYDDGKLVSKNKETYNVYEPHEEIIYVGTKVKEPEPEESNPNEKKQKTKTQDANDAGEDEDEN